MAKKRSASSPPPAPTRASRRLRHQTVEFTLNHDVDRIGSARGRRGRHGATVTTAVPLATVSTAATAATAATAMITAAPAVAVVAPPAPPSASSMPTTTSAQPFDPLALMVTAPAYASVIPSTTTTQIMTSTVMFTAAPTGPSALSQTTQSQQIAPSRTTPKIHAAPEIQTAENYGEADDNDESLPSTLQRNRDPVSLESGGLAPPAALPPPMASATTATTLPTPAESAAPLAYTSSARTPLTEYTSELDKSLFGSSPEATSPPPPPPPPNRSDPRPLPSPTSCVGTPLLPGLAPLPLPGGGRTLHQIIGTGPNMPYIRPGPPARRADITDDNINAAISRETSRRARQSLGETEVLRGAGLSLGDYIRQYSRQLLDRRTLDRINQAIENEEAELEEFLEEQHQRQRAERTPHPTSGRTQVTTSTTAEPSGNAVQGTIATSSTPVLGPMVGNSTSAVAVGTAASNSRTRADKDVGEKKDPSQGYKRPTARVAVGVKPLAQAEKERQEYLESEQRGSPPPNISRPRPMPPAPAPLPAAPRRGAPRSRAYVTTESQEYAGGPGAAEQDEESEDEYSEFVYDL